MSKSSCRPNSEAIKRKRKEKKKAEQALRKHQRSKGLVKLSKASGGRWLDPLLVQKRLAAHFQLRLI